MMKQNLEEIKAFFAKDRASEGEMTLSKAGIHLLRLTEFGQQPNPGKGENYDEEDVQFFRSCGW